LAAARGDQVAVTVRRSSSPELDLGLRAGDEIAVAEVDALDEPGAAWQIDVARGRVAAEHQARPRFPALVVAERHHHVEDLDRGALDDDHQLAELTVRLADMDHKADGQF